MLFILCIVIFPNGAIKMSLKVKIKLYLVPTVLDLVHLELAGAHSPITR